MMPIPTALRWLFLALIVSSRGWAVSAAASASPAHVRVVSQTVGSDELLLALAEPEQVAALSHLSRESIYSAVAEEAK